MFENKLKIIEKLKSAISEEKDILFAYLHGSFLNNEENYKDIDIGLYLNENILSKIDHIDYEISFSLRLEKIIGIPVDIKILNFSPICFKYNVSLGYLLFSCDEEKREEFLCKVWDEYFDFLPISKIYLKEVLDAKI
jgi:predicted nucleotidyltransferase